MATHTVVAGDTLWALAKTYNTTVDELARINNIKNPDLIYIGQELKLDGEPDDTTNVSSKANITHFGIQANTDRTLFAVWSWDRDNTENYEVYWQYATGDGVWFTGNKSTVDEKQSLYTAPSNATRVQFRVKPISKDKKVDSKTTTKYWTAQWSTEKIYDFRGDTSTPPVPKVEIKDFQLTATIDNINHNDINASTIQFQVVKDNSKVFNTGTAIIQYSQVTYTCRVTAGSMYKVRCRAQGDLTYSEWSNYSDSVGTPPSAPASITECKAASETSVYLSWSGVDIADSYEIEYATEKRYFDLTSETTKVGDIERTSYEITGLDSGKQYFFRVRAVNEHGTSGWTPLKTTVIGEPPVAPTTYSSTTTAIMGEDVTLYWVHNAEDGSSEIQAEIKLSINGVTRTIKVNKSTDEDEKDKVSYYVLSTSGYAEDTEILWQVRTAGITKDYGEWSVQRSIKIYAPATIEMRVTDLNANVLDTITSFPFRVYALAGPSSQMPIGYHLAIIANSAYETTDDIGNTKYVNIGDEVYSKYFDINTELLVDISAGNVDLENNVRYTVICTSSMDSGLTAEARADIRVSWMDLKYEPNAEVGINTDNYSAYIRPYCVDETDKLIENVTLSVYRREYNGDFTEIASDLVNSRSTFITDPHPSLDYARYRVVAKTIDTGSVSYCDIPGYPVGGKAAIIQWNEEWSSFDAVVEDGLVDRPWSGSMLILPYNVDVSDSYSLDVEHVEYIGREHPVSYHGTQIGETSSWNVEIPKSDKETLYGLRRLATWMGNVYVREPSGSGYWATITVSFSQKHCDVTIPVSFNITRVEGGV